MIKIAFGCSPVYVTRVPQSLEMRRLVEEAKRAGRSSNEIYQALRANKDKHKSQHINLSEVRLALGLRS